jgi:hypothetical protein
VEFNGVLADWSDKVKRRAESASAAATSLKADVLDMTIGQIVGSLKPAQLWALVGAATAIVVGAFSLGAKIGAL